MPTLTTLAEAHAALERLEQRYAARDAIRWAIELVEQGEMIGTVGLLRFDFEHRHAEIGYEIARRWWGRGLTPEAAAAVIRYGFSVLGLHRIEAGVLPGNEASVRVLQKLGFNEEGTRRDYLYSKGRFQAFGGSACSRQTSSWEPPNDRATWRRCSLVAPGRAG